MRAPSSSTGSRGPCSGGRRRRATGARASPTRRRCRARRASRGSRARRGRRCRRARAASGRRPTTSCTQSSAAISPVRLVGARRRELDADGVAAQVALQRLRRALDDDLAAADDREPVGELVGLLEVVRRQQDRQPLAAPARRSSSSHIAARASGSRPVVGSSRKSTRRPVDEPERDVEPPLHAARVAADDRSAASASPNSSSSSSTRSRSARAAECPGRGPGASRFSRPVASRSTPEACGT